MANSMINTNTHWRAQNEEIIGNNVQWMRWMKKNSNLFKSTRNYESQKHEKKNNTSHLNRLSLIVLWSGRHTLRALARDLFSHCAALCPTAFSFGGFSLRFLLLWWLFFWHRLQYSSVDSMQPGIFEMRVIRNFYMVLLIKKKSSGFIRHFHLLVDFV